MYSSRKTGVRFFPSQQANTGQFYVYKKYSLLSLARLNKSQHFSSRSWWLEWPLLATEPKCFWCSHHDWAADTCAVSSQAIEAQTKQNDTPTAFKKNLLLRTQNGIRKPRDILDANTVELEMFEQAGLRNEGRLSPRVPGTRHTSYLLVFPPVIHPKDPKGVYPVITPISWHLPPLYWSLICIRFSMWAVLAAPLLISGRARRPS